MPKVSPWHDGFTLVIESLLNAHLMIDGSPVTYRVQPMRDFETEWCHNVQLEIPRKYWSVLLERLFHGPLARYETFRDAHASGMPETFSPPPGGSNPGMRHGTCAAHVPWCMPGSLTSGFRWSRWREKSSRHSRRMRNPQFYVSVKRPITETIGADPSIYCNPYSTYNYKIGSVIL